MKYHNEYTGFDSWLKRVALTLAALVACLIFAAVATAQSLEAEVQKIASEQAAEARAAAKMHTDKCIEMLGDEFAAKIAALEAKVAELEAKPTPPQLPTIPVETVTLPQVIHVAADGNDAADGLTPQTAVRTPRVGYEKLRNGVADQLRFRAGDTFTSPIGELDRSGRSAEQPQIIGVYGPPEAGRPRFEVEGDVWIGSEFKTDTRYVLIQGLEAVAVNRDPQRPGFDPATLGGDWKLGGIVLLGDDSDIRVADCKLSFFSVAIVAQSDANHGYMTGITLHRNIVVDGYGHWDKNVGGHSQGLYAQYADGLTISENLFDHNGWNDAVPGASRTVFNHNLYIQSDCQNVTARGNIIARGSSHGMQLRPGGVVEDNFFVGNALALLLGGGENLARGNVILQSTDLRDSPGWERGSGIEINPCQSAVVTGNIIAQKLGTADHLGAIHAEWKREMTDEPFELQITDNRVYRWKYRASKPQDYRPQTDAAKSSIAVNNAAKLIEYSGNVADDPAWVEPGRDLASYAKSIGLAASTDAWLSAAAQRGRGTWPAELSAAGAIEYVREGFKAR